MTHTSLIELRKELRRGGIIEAPLQTEKFHLSGLYDPDTEIVIVNPQPELALSVLHELTHRAHPRWGEGRVDRESRGVLRGMSDEDVADLLRMYRRLRHRRKVVVVEAVK